MLGRIGCNEAVRGCGEEQMKENWCSMNDDFDLKHDRDEERDDDLGDKGRKNQAKGNLRETAGKIQEGFGKLTGQKDVEREGRAKQMQGKAQNLGGRVQEGADDMLEDLRPDSDDPSRD